MDQQLFEQMYQGQAPWDTGRPQPAIIKLAEADQIRGSVLDVGCGTGENVLYSAANGHESWGLDFLPVVIERAKVKALLASELNDHLPACLESIKVAAEPFQGQVEIVVTLNRCTDRTGKIALAHGAKVVHDDSRNMARIRNAAARMATGEVIVTIDADSRMTSNMLVEIDRLLRTGQYIGGGVRIMPERWSVGIFVTVLMLTLAMGLLWRRVSAGLFWCLRQDFESIGGFNENLVSLETLSLGPRPM